LQSLLLNLKNQRNEFQSEININQQNSMLIAGLKEVFIPVVNEIEIIEKYKQPKILLENSYQKAYENNPKYLAAIKIAESQELYLAWQKSMKIPDLTTGLAYDQRGGAFQNQLNITLGIPLAYRNQNKGNIKIANAELNKSYANKTYQMEELKSQIKLAWLAWERQKEQIEQITIAMDENLELVYRGVIENFRKRNISMLEFTDFLESYNLSIMQKNDIKKQWILSGLTINYITNEEIF